MKNYLKQYLAREEKNIDISLKDRGAKSAKTPPEVGSVSFGTSIPYEYQEKSPFEPITALETVCPQCGGELETKERKNYWLYTCKQKQYNCYEEIRRKPEADRLWDDIPIPQELKPDRQYHSALEGLGVLGLPKQGSCEVGCGNLIQFYFVDGVGFGYCPKCRVDQTLYENRLM